MCENTYEHAVCFYLNCPISSIMMQVLFSKHLIKL